MRSRPSNFEPRESRKQQLTNFRLSSDKPKRFLLSNSQPSKGGGLMQISKGLRFWRLERSAAIERLEQLEQVF
jgi:hypothetical protein